ncbi:NAD(P)-binding domain-containing protein [Rhodobacteraceae bacterium M382]|nr:NAD(P)-binding domain-containing protein [Rhodobacteraceae bacterium M382]
MKIGVIGTGTIASAVVHGLAGQGHGILVSERSADKAAELAARIEEVNIADNQSILNASDVVFLGLMAEHATEVLQPLSFDADHRIVSLMAGASLDQVQHMVGPAKAEAVMIPFPGIALGGSPIMVRGNAALIRDLFAPANSVFDLKTDAELAAYLCAQAVLSPAAKMVNGAAGWLGERVADPQQAEDFLRVLVGSSLLASETGPLLEALDTPGGYNARLRDHMVDQGMAAALMAGLDNLSET